MNQEKIGKFIAKLRKEKNMTQEELAEKLGVTDKSISRWENGRCMPDLSLFAPLSEELGISINDLMSGEKVDIKEYQESFEKNMVETISKVEKNNRIWNIICNSIIIGIAIIFTAFISYLFLDNYRFKINYNSEYMKLTDLGNNQLEFAIINTANPYPEYMLRNYKNSDDEIIGIIFVTGSQSILSSSRNIQERNECINFNGCLKHMIKIDLNRENYNDFPSKYKIYYSKVDFKKIIKADQKELKNIIKQSNLMYEKNIISK